MAGPRNISKQYSSCSDNDVAPERERRERVSCAYAWESGKRRIRGHWRLTTEAGGSYEDKHDRLPLRRAGSHFRVSLFLWRQGKRKRRRNS